MRKKKSNAGFTFSETSSGRRVIREGKKERESHFMFILKKQRENR